MQRLISLFREPEDPWPSLATAQDDGERQSASQLKGEPKDPLYFVELMAYLRDRNRAPGARAVAHEPREGAD